MGAPGLPAPREGELPGFRLPSKQPGRPSCDSTHARNTGQEWRVRAEQFRGHVRPLSGRAWPSWLWSGREDVLVEDARVQDAEGSQLQNPAVFRGQAAWRRGSAGSRPWGRRGWVCAGRAGDRTPESGCSQRKGCQRAGRSACAGARGGCVLAVSERSSSRMPGMCFPRLHGPVFAAHGGQASPHPAHLTPAGRGRTCRARTPRRVPPAVIPAAQQKVLITVEGSGVAVSAAGEAGSGDSARRGGHWLGGSGHNSSEARSVPEGPWVLERGLGGHL